MAGGGAAAEGIVDPDRRPAGPRATARAAIPLNGS